MAFEIYDDIAFFWFFETLLFIVLVPFTIHMINLFRNRDSLDDISTATENEKEKMRKIISEQRAQRRRAIFSFKTAIFIALWALFLHGMTQVSNYQREELATFDPYTILEIERGASEVEIKKAYRKLSVKYHPDKNPDNLEKFLLISKAEKVLTDETTRFNWERYGNPDGYQGTSVTIGLPSSLLRKENELTVLIFYFVLIVVIPPIGVGLWWSASRDVHETGVKLNTIRSFYYYLNENTPLKSLVEVLCTAQEYEIKPRGPFKPEEIQPDVQRLAKALGDDLPKPRTRVWFAHFGTVLLFGHLLRETKTLSNSSKKYLNLILKNCHKFLAVLLDLSPAKTQYFKLSAIQSLMELSQHIVQAIYFGESSLYQLPHLSPDLVSELKRTKKTRTPISTSDAMRALSPEERRSLLREGLTEKQWKDIDHVCDLLPDPQIELSWEVEGAKGCFEGDLVKVTAVISRKPEPTPSQKSANNSNNPDDVEAEEDEEASDDEGVFNEERRKRMLKKKRRDLSPVLVHAPLFPEKKFERWIAVLVEEETGHVLNMSKISSLLEPQEVQLHFFASKGQLNLRVHVLCDSYLGCDRSKELKISVKPKRTAETETADDTNVLKDDDEEEKEEESATSTLMGWLDLIATGLLLCLMAFAGYSYASQKPWFQKNFEPHIDQFLVAISPVTSRIATFLEPVTQLWAKYVSPLLLVDKPVEAVKIDPSRLAQWSQRVLP
eukprot:c8095_g1_i1.p1 GENE.c8095_g1_i1~~c8095_g1_i1.p1  ORF type:complete len:733 (-),score=174.36 c8095_g1_i1:74-2242(-)